MSYEPPTPPGDAPTEVIEQLETLKPETLRQISRYANELADHREREARLEEETKAAESEETADRPADVPARATVTVKEINNNRYYYWQWREGDKVRSQYKSPVDTDE